MCLGWQQFDKGINSKKLNQTRLNLILFYLFVIKKKKKKTIVLIINVIIWLIENQPLQTKLRVKLSTNHLSQIPQNLCTGYDLLCYNKVNS